MKLYKFLIFSALFSMACFGGSYLFARQAGYKKDGELGEFLVKSYMSSKDFAIEVAQEVKIPKQELTTLVVDVPKHDVEIAFAPVEEVVIRLNGKILKNKKDQVVPQIVQTELSQTALKVSVNEDAMSSVIENTDNGRNFHVNVNGINFGNTVGLLIQLPMQFKHLELRSTSGDVFLHGGRYESVFARATSGDIKLRDVKSEEISYELTSGDIEGDLDAAQINGESTSGDVELKLKRSETGGEISSTSGEVNLEFKTEPNLKLMVISSSGEIKLFGDEADDEQEQVEKTLGQGAGALKIQTTSGDIEVE